MQYQRYLKPNSPQLVPAHPDFHKKLQEAYDAGDLDAFPADPNDIIGMNDALNAPANPAHGVAQAKAAAAKAHKPLSGKIKILVILIEFSDVKMDKGMKAHFQTQLFSKGKNAAIAPYGTVNDYYHEVSNGTVDLEGDVFGPYMMPHTQKHYANGVSGSPKSTQPQHPSARDMADDAVAALLKDQPKLDLADYDNSGDGWVEGCVIVHAGPDGAAAKDVKTGKNQMWSLKWNLNTPVKRKKTSISKFLTVAGEKATATIGTPCHELGHLLFALPDLYDNDNQDNAGIGEWGLMGGGGYLGGASCPCHLSAWSKMQLGWVEVEEISDARDLVIEPVETSRKIYRMYRYGDRKSKEYFLIENRQKIGFDAKLPGAGLLIWHVDDSVANNRNDQHPKVRLMQADGKNDLVTGNNGNRGDATDPYPSAAKSLTFSSRPKALSYFNDDSGVRVKNIVRDGKNIKCHVGYYDEIDKQLSTGVGRYSVFDGLDYHGMGLHRMRGQRGMRHVSPANPGSWIKNGSLSQWIDVPKGKSTFSVMFGVDKHVDIDKAVLRGKWSTDDTAKMYLNTGGKWNWNPFTSTLVATLGGGSYVRWTDFSISKAQGLKHGTNELRIIVDNTGGPGGLRVEIADRDLARTYKHYLAIGDVHEGGIVFSLSRDGKSGSVISAADVSGQQSWQSAIDTCNGLSLGGFNDWRLPDWPEWNKIYANLYKQGLGGLVPDNYWTANAGYGPSTARYMNIRRGRTELLSPSDYYRVRAVRDF